MTGSTEQTGAGARGGVPGAALPPCVLRGAAAADVPELNRLTRRAKAHWGYSEEQLDAWRAELTITTQSLDTAPTVIAQVGERIAGFYQLRLDVDPPELDHLWVDPAAMGQGVGRMLVRHALEQLAAGGWTEMAIDADPYAEGFYCALGARRIGAVAAPLPHDAERVRPQLRITSPLV